MKAVCPSFFHTSSRFFSTDSKRQVKVCAQLRKHHDIQFFWKILEKQQKSGFSNLSAPFFRFFFRFFFSSFQITVINKRIIPGLDFSSTSAMLRPQFFKKTTIYINRFKILCKCSVWEESNKLKNVKVEFKCSWSWW